MEDLNLMDLYQSNNKRAESFSKSVDSNLNVTTDYDKVECNFDWLDIMEETIRYIDNILRNPNRFIINEEDIVKIELARRVTVESIKHLARNTNLIKDIDKKTGYVKPSKILNINKEESFNTYENRFIFSLINNMKMYIARKKSNLVSESSLKSYKKMDYKGIASLGSEKVNISLNMESRINKKDEHKNGECNDALERIAKLEEEIANLTGSDIYKNLAKLHVAMVMSPIKKTNLILKNVNFQYALKLWDYMQSHMEDDVKRQKQKKSYEDKGDLKKLIDESFALDYLVMDTLSKDKSKLEIDKKEREQITEQLASNMLDKIVQLNGEMSEEQIKDLVGKQFAIIKYRTVVNDSQIEKKFKESISSYITKINDLELEVKK